MPETKEQLIGSSDEALMQLAAKGRRIAFELIYDRYFEKLTWYAFGFIKDMQRSEDLVQDVFCVLIDNPTAFDHSLRFSTWMYTSVGNRCRNELRNRNNRAILLKQHAANNINSTETTQKAAEPDLRESIIPLLAELTDKERIVYHLRFEEERKLKDIAEVSGLPEGSVKSCIYYLTKKLAKQLKEIGYGR